MRSGWFWRRLGREDSRGEVEREIAFHLEMRAREFKEQGLTDEEALAAAAESFGDTVHIADWCEAERRLRSRSLRRREALRDLTGEVKLAVRSLRKSRLFTLSVVSTLAAGIALTTVVASLVDAYLLRGLPYPDPDRLVFVQGSGSPDWREPTPVLEQAIAWDLDALSIVSGGSPERVWTSWVTPSFFGVLAVEPALGRLFTNEDALAGGESVAVISHGLWQRRWGGDRGVLGRTFTAYSDDRPEDAEVFTIVGVLPPDFWYFNRFTEVLAPLNQPRATAVARLAPGVTLQDAERRLAGDARERNPARSDVRLVPIHQSISEQVKPVLMALAGGVLLVLLLACGNAAVLQIVRAVGREREFAVRAAIGAGRQRIVRQLLAEGMVVAAAATVVGVTTAWVVLRLLGETLTGVLAAPVPGGEGSLRVDGAALLVAAGAAALAALLFTLIPLFGLSRLNLASVLSEGSRGTDGRRRQRLRSTLVAFELALSLALLIGAGLLVRSAAHLQKLELGFDPQGVAAIDVSLRQRTYVGAGRVEVFENMVARIHDDVPELRAGLVSWAPFSRLGTEPVETPDQLAADSARAAAFNVAASPEYFEVMGIALLRGRVFDQRDRAGAMPVAIVSKRLADQLWPGNDALGQRLRIAASSAMAAHGEAPPSWSTVIGVVADARKTLTQENPPDLYFAFAQSTPARAELVVRDPTGRRQLRALQQAVWQVDPDVPLNGIRWIEDDIATASLPSRFLAGLISAFAVFAMGLATLALYSAIAFAVLQRRRDIAIRMALGATRTQVVTLFLRAGVRLIAIGLLAGLAGALALSRILSSQLYGVSSTDWITYIAVALVLGAAALLATWLPSQRAANASPMQTLQS